MRLSCLTRFLPIPFLILCCGSDAWTALPTSVELVDDTGWRYFYHHSGEPLTSPHALEPLMIESGFYENWTQPDFDEPNVSTREWRDAILPIGYAVNELYNEEGYATRLRGLHGATAFLRRTFEVPTGVGARIGIEAVSIGSVLYVDGEEVGRNCCFDVERPGILDRADESIFSATLDMYTVDLAPGEHTLAVTTHADKRGRNFFKTRLYSPITEKVWNYDSTLPQTDLDWFDDGNWQFGRPGVDDFAVFRMKSSVGQLVNLPSTVTLQGLQFDPVSPRPSQPIRKGVIINGAEIVLGNNASVGSLNSFLGTHALNVELRLGGDVDADVSSRSLLQLNQELRLDGHTLTLAGGGILEVSGDTNANDGTLVIEDGIVGGNGVIGGDVSTAGGIIRPKVGDEFSNLTINGNFSGNVDLSGDNATAHDSLTGQGGVANIDVLTLELPRGQFRGGEVYELLPGWSEITVADLRLPAVSSSGWDTSRLSEGIVSILPSDPLRCDLDQSGSCDVLDLDFLGNRINGTYEQSADLNRDGTIDLLDRDELLLDMGGIFLGDADLDGDVDVSDLNWVGFNWQQCDFISWSDADFNFDGCIDSLDLNEVGKNWQRGVARFASTRIEGVPEPTGHLLWLFGVLLLRGRVHISRLAISQLSFCRGRCP